MMDSAIVRKHTNNQRDIVPTYMEMKRKFVCNRDEWLRNIDSVDLKCDMLPRFLQLSIIDFVAAQLFPFIFSIHIFIIINVIVYEKENKLRIIMKMNGGLENSIYWMVNYFFYHYIKITVQQFYHHIR